MKSPTGRNGFALCGVAVLLFVFSVKAAFPDSMSKLAVRILQDKLSWCTGEDVGNYYTIDLEGGMTAEILHINCSGACGSGGCTSYIIIDQRVYELFGSRPFPLKGTGQDHDDVAAIGWFAGANGCNDNVNAENCLFTAYWQAGAGKLMHIGASEIPGEFLE